MKKLQLSLITAMFLCVLTTISSKSKDHENVVGSINTQNTEVMLDLNSNQRKCEQSFEDQQDASKKVQNKTLKYTGVTWNKDNKKWRVQLTQRKGLSWWFI